ncbi:MAG: hypothetical protein V4504_01330 [Patescibacteria group bacterium]
MKKLAFKLNAGQKIACLNGQCVCLDQNWNYVPSKSEEDTLLPIGNSDWVDAKKRMKGVIELSETQEKAVKQALNDREAYFITKQGQINQVSIKDISSLSKLQPESLFVKLMLWMKYFTILPENKAFRDELGFVLFDKMVCLIKRLNPSKQKEVIVLFRKRFNQDAPEHLQKLMRTCLLDAYEGQRKKPVSLKKFKIYAVKNFVELLEEAA